MKPGQRAYDAVVIGGGFYGCCLAVFLSDRGNRVLLVERGEGLLGRASWANQARIHQGYHYPRSFVTGLRSAANFERFVEDFAPAVYRDFTKVYAVAAHHSRVTASQFWHFCRNIGAPIREAPRHIKALFTPDMIEDVFLVREFAFDASRLHDLLFHRLRERGVALLLETEVVRVEAAPHGLCVVTREGRLEVPRVFACTYAQMNHLLAASGLPLLPVKLEVTEIALVEPPPRLRDLGVTVMDGPFFSAMPFPAEALHSLSHVRYTPHEQHAHGSGCTDAYGYLSARRWRSNFAFMLRDAVRYLPPLGDSRYVRSLFEMKAVLLANEANDGRPILYRCDYGLPGLTLILGGKLDNVYDILQAVDADLNRSASPPTPFPSREKSAVGGLSADENVRRTA